ncbi:MAG: hypothetical protein HON76_05330 [Candidatus Scalindua sp.]|jgi:transcription initiation factor IIE alpha subunit|nr:hypothetical protein [Candidatus Scalindua sp.]MBT5306471.1 hypothetical protein [Candidatus Scalindua sp.]MBT6047318.1 hypothetical protein [Candidatus Scalindua sp.]MBT6228604.1 hypothetical protein [Candidatus Scalindua sp.]MBT6561932.1 hypothetical protein [Candidatus Scalindua sp.]
MSIDVADIAAKMLEAFKGQLTKKWPEVKVYAETEARKLAETLVMIEKLKLAGEITDEQAKLQLQIQKNACRTVFLAIEGLGIIAVEQAINAALGVLKDAINTALKFPLI